MQGAGAGAGRRIGGRHGGGGGGAAGIRTIVAGGSFSARAHLLHSFSFFSVNEKVMVLTGLFYSSCECSEKSS